MASYTPSTNLARAMSKPSKAHMAAAKHLLRYLAGTVDFAITYKHGGFKLTAFSDANWGHNPDNGKSMSSYIVFLANAPVSFKVGLQGLTAQSIMEAELVAATLAMKEAVFCSNMMKELGFGTRFDSVPLCIDNARLCMSPEIRPTVRELSTWLYGTSSSRSKSRRAESPLIM